MPSRARHVLGLDVVRLLAATLVMVYHFGFWNWVSGQSFARAMPGPPPPWASGLHFGWVGVEIFFVISGFVIAFSAANASHAAFARSRFLRLAPASWIAATLVLGVHWASAGAPAAAGVRLYLQTLAFWPLDAIDNVWWTLGIEIDFYLLVYGLIRTGRTASLERVMVAIGIAGGMFWAAALGLQAALAGGTGLAGGLHILVLKAQGNRELQLLLVQHGCFFALGVVLWKASAVGISRARAAAMAVLGGACILEILGQNGIIERASHHTLPAGPAIAVWVGAVAMLVTAVAWNGAISRRIGAWAPLIRFAGLATYPLYLTHNAVGSLVTVSLAGRFGSTACMAGLCAAFGCAAIVAGLLEPRLRGSVALLLPDPRGASAAHGGQGFGPETARIAGET